MGKLIIITQSNSIRSRDVHNEKLFNASEPMIISVNFHTYYKHELEFAEAVFKNELTIIFGAIHLVDSTFLFIGAWIHHSMSHQNTKTR